MKKRIFVFLFGMVLFACSSYAQLTQADLDAASAGRLAVVGFADLPPSGTFWSWANGWATPFDIWPDLTCYDLGGGSYLLDDRGYSYDEAARSGRLAVMVDDASGPLGADGGPSLPLPWSAGDCGCAPWLTISLTGTNAVLVSAHRLVAGQTCSIYSSTNIALALTNWSFETNLLAGVGPGTVLVQMGGRSNLFFRAAVTNYQATNYVVDTNSTFTGLTYEDTGYVTPDTMGGIGGSDTSSVFLEVLNGNAAAVAVYDRAGNVVVATNSGFLGGTMIVVYCGTRTHVDG